MSEIHPIIYVRGYAMTRGEIDETTADPFCGFNLGSTAYRATPDKDKPAKKFIFESPVIRLHSDFDYADVFESGLDIMDAEWEGEISRRSIIIYHYYEQASTLLGRGTTPTIREFASGLSDLILRVKQLVKTGKDNEYQSRDEFKCYLVAHSMGGLVCRAFLQNPALGVQEARDSVAKVFTYATPHNGIEVAGINIPSWLSIDDMNNFSREEMAKYLDLSGLYLLSKRVDWVPADLAEKFFCMIGTNRADYEVAMGASRTFAGHGSDGLVRIENASVWGVDGSGNPTGPCATSYAYRSHSGYFGIVNSEESYQSLVRFLFGDLRVDVWCDVTGVTLPEELRDKESVDALYQFELLASPRGKRWYLTRRTSEEDSVACCSHRDLTAALHKDTVKPLYLSTVFLGSKWKVDTSKASLAYSLTLGVRVPDYEVERRFWFDGHYEGGYLFRDTAIIEITTPQNGGGWQVMVRWQGGAAGPQAVTPVPALDGRQQLIAIPFASTGQPGVSGNIRLVVTPWNR
jgi:PGAP1-like protein